MTGTPKISVVVPVWNGTHQIGLLLDALERQTASRTDFEVIVVDNGSTDATATVVASYPWIRLTSETRPGSYAARNHAIGLAKGKFLLFTDADCVPAEDWIERALARADAHGENSLIGGRIKLFRSDNAGPFSSRYDELTAGFNQEWNLANRLCVTANWLCSKALLEKVGLFNATLISGGDGECAGRIHDSGAELIYAPEMVVHHPTRANLLLLIRKKRRVIGGRWQKTIADRSFTGFSRKIAQEYLDQARWMKNSDIPTKYKPGVLMVVASLWAVTQFEVIRLAAGRKPYRN